MQLNKFGINNKIWEDLMKQNENWQTLEQYLAHVDALLAHVDALRDRFILFEITSSAPIAIITADGSYLGILVGRVSVGFAGGEYAYLVTGLPGGYMTVQPIVEPGAGYVSVTANTALNDFDVTVETITGNHRVGLLTIRGKVTVTTGS